jgi:pentatricopeptide repeat protein
MVDPGSARARPAVPLLGPGGAPAPAFPRRRPRSAPVTPLLLLDPGGASARRTLRDPQPLHLPHHRMRRVQEPRRRQGRPRAPLRVPPLGRRLPLQLAHPPLLQARRAPGRVRSVRRDASPGRGLMDLPRCRVRAERHAGGGRRAPPGHARRSRCAQRLHLRQPLEGGRLHRLHAGEQVHSLVVRRGWHDDVYIRSALLDMYARRGRMDDAVAVFRRLRSRNGVPWNALIAGFARTCSLRLRSMDLQRKQIIFQENGVNF